MSKYGYSRKDIAQATGRNERTVSVWRFGKTAPKTQDLKKIVDLSGITIDDFLKLND